MSVAGLRAEELFALFPVTLFVLLAGITYMFSVAQHNGTMAFVTKACVRLVRGRVALMPWIFHGPSPSAPSAPAPPRRRLC